MGFSTVGIQGSGTAGLLAAFTAPTRIGNALANGVGVLTNDGAGNLSWGAGASSKWNALTAPDGNLAMAHAGYTTAFTWNAATGAGTNLFTLQDTAANTGTGSLLNVVTGAGSALNPLRVVAAGTTSLAVSAAGAITLNAVAYTWPAAGGHGWLTNNGLNTLSWSAGTNGQIPVGTTGGAITWTTPTAGANITITPGAGSLGIACSISARLPLLFSGSVLGFGSAIAPTVADAWVDALAGASAATMTVFGIQVKNKQSSPAMTFEDDAGNRIVDIFIGGTTAGQFNTNFGVNAGQQVSQHAAIGTLNSSFGYNCLALVSAGSSNCGFGASALTTTVNGNRNSAFGAEALTASTGDGNTCVGYRSGYGVTTGQSNIYLGARAGYDQTIESNQFIAGSELYPVYDVWFGIGKHSAAPLNYTIHGTDGDGMDVYGADVILAPGRPTGSGVPGNFVLQFAPAGASGVTLRTLRTSLMARGSVVPDAFTGAADTAGIDMYFRSQSGGAHTLNNPRGGDVIFQMGAGGAGGTGRAGRFQVLTGNVNLDAQTASSMLYLNAAKDVVSTAAPTNGQILIGSTGAVPALATITQGTNIAVTNAAGSITVGITGTIGVTNGGTGLGTWNAYAIPYASAANTLAEVGSAKIRPAADPGAFTAAADTDGTDTYLRTQSGGAHALNNPRGGDLIVQLGAAGAGGTGRIGRFQILSGALNLSPLTASTVIYLDANKNVVSLANANGVLTNDGAGNLSWGPGGDTGTLAVALTDAATIAVDASLGKVNSDSLYWVLLTGSGHAMGIPTNPTTGQIITFRIKQPAAGGPYTFSFTTGAAGAFRFNDDITGFTASTTANYVDYVRARYNLQDDRWDIIGVILGAH